MTRSTKASPGEQRRHPRHSVMWSGTLTAETEFDMYVLDCRINNFSISGVHVFVERALHTDHPITLKINGVGEFMGRIAWTEGNQIGVKFDDAPDRVAALTKDKF
jgi:hypothetical protein